MASGGGLSMRALWGLCFLFSGVGRGSQARDQEEGTQDDQDDHRGAEEPPFVWGEARHDEDDLRRFRCGFSKDTMAV